MIRYYKDETLKLTSKPKILWILKLWLKVLKSSQKQLSAEVPKQSCLEQTLRKKGLHRRYFAVNLVTFFRTAIIKSTYGQGFSFESLSLETFKQEVCNDLRTHWRLIFANVIRFSRLRLWIGYFICFKFTPVFFYLMFLMDVL